MRPLSCSTMLVWAWLHSQVKLGAEGQSQLSKYRAQNLAEVIIRGACLAMDQDSILMRAHSEGAEL